MYFFLITSKIHTLPSDFFRLTSNSGRFRANICRKIRFMKTKKEIVENWLPRYTGQALNQFGEYILLTNFDNYVKMFAEWHNVPINGSDKPMRSATAEGITIINFGMGSPNAATVMDCLSAIQPKAALFLGKCGGLKKKNDIGDML